MNAEVPRLSCSPSCADAERAAVDVTLSEEERFEEAACGSPESRVGGCWKPFPVPLFEEE